MPLVQAKSPLTTLVFSPNSVGGGVSLGLRLSTLEQLDVGSVAKVSWHIERKCVANRLWWLSTFCFLAEGVVHDMNNGNLIRRRS